MNAVSTSPIPPAPVPAAPSPPAPSPAAPSPPGPGAVEAGQARQAVIAAVQWTLEVLDGRRRADQLTRVLAPDLAAQVAALLRHRGTSTRGAATARVVRVHLQMRHAGRGSPCADYFGTFARGGRIRAVAGRVELTRVRVAVRGTPRGDRIAVSRWVVTELTIV